MCFAGSKGTVKGIEGEYDQSLILEELIALAYFVMDFSEFIADIVLLRKAAFFAIQRLILGESLVR